MSILFNNVCKIITTRKGNKCGVLSFHLHGDVVAIGLSAVSAKAIDAGKFKFEESYGKKLADERASLAFKHFMENKKVTSPTMSIIDMSKCTDISSFKDVVQKTKALQYTNPKNQRKQLTIHT